MLYPNFEAATEHFKRQLENKPQHWWAPEVFGVKLKHKKSEIIYSMTQKLLEDGKLYVGGLDPSVSPIKFLKAIGRNAKAEQASRTRAPRKKTNNSTKPNNSTKTNNSMKTKNETKVGVLTGRDQLRPHWLTLETRMTSDSTDTMPQIAGLDLQTLSTEIKTEHERPHGIHSSLNIDVTDGVLNPRYPGSEYPITSLVDSTAEGSLMDEGLASNSHARSTVTIDDLKTLEDRLLDRVASMLNPHLLSDQQTGRPLKEKEDGSQTQPSSQASTEATAVLEMSPAMMVDACTQTVPFTTNSSAGKPLIFSCDVNAHTSFSSSTPDSTRRCAARESAHRGLQYQAQSLSYINAVGFGSEQAS
jgi:hypothetical protein